ncbi:MAG: carboxypeptidase regulatory-like domain-containing protein [Ruminococcus sp.]|nr:carboxypeptidase regulatory-like domain-containing protein [Ruminococcus sp.]
MRKLLCLMLAVIMIASVAIVAVHAEEGTATVTLKNVKGESVTQTYRVGETFTAYTYLNTSEINDGKVGSMSGIQHYDPAILKVADAYETENEYDYGLVEDIDAMFPVVGSACIANAGDVDNGNIYYNASVPGYGGFGTPFNSDETALIIVHYTVIAPSEATITNQMETLAASDKNLTRIIDANEIVNDNFNMPVALSEPETPAGFTVSGSVTSYLQEKYPDAVVTVKLTGTDNNFTASVTGTDSYSIADVPAGSYELSVEKEKHVTRTYDVTVSADTTQDVKICPIGDATNDGKVNMFDYNAVYKHVAKNPELAEGSYQKACADATGDKKVNMFDYNAIYKHANKTKLLF